MATHVNRVAWSAPQNVGALVMGGDYRALALVRSLGRNGVNVWVINQADQRWAGASRYARRTFFYPTWQDSGAVEYVLEIGRNNGLDGWLLFPTSDESVRLASSHHERLAEVFQMTVPPWATLQWVVDKRRLHELAEKAGVEHANTVYPRSREELFSLNLTFPVILKPATRDQFNRLTAAKAWRVEDLNGLLTRYDEACQLLPPELIMIQELIPGGGESQFSFAAVCNNGNALVSLVARRTRQFPMDLGRASTFVETVDEPGVIGPANRILKAIEYTGLVEVEFKRDPRTGQFVLLDVNPRVWGWYSLCERAGANFGYLLWLLCQGQPIPDVHVRPGVRWFRLTTDVLTSLREICGRRMSIREYFHSMRGPKESAIFASDDPWPGLIELPLLFYLFVKRFIRGRGV